MATTEFQARLTGVTLSPNNWPSPRMARLGTTEAWPTCALQDYRDDPGCAFRRDLFDRNGRAVGREYWPPYFAERRHPTPQAGRSRLHPEHRDRRRPGDRYIRSTDFIQQYIFPAAVCPARASSAAKPPGRVGGGTNWPSARLRRETPGAAENSWRNASRSCGNWL